MAVKWYRTVSVLAVMAGFLFVGGEAAAEDPIEPGHSYVESVRLSSPPPRQNGQSALRPASRSGIIVKAASVRPPKVCRLPRPDVEWPRS
ncbi:hypothetical protein SAMN04489733_3611 [Amycolatopsis keratiniphila]|nr:hypothetical protein SAMN04489733_3611 [Amycolatopsis keratiniphila]